jgi:hypothetical protein
MNIAEHFQVTGPRGFFRPLGDAPLEEAVGWVTAAILHARETGLTELLVDARDVTGFSPPNVFQRYHLMKEWLAAAAGRVRTAMVVRTELIDHRKFGVMVAENRGFTTDVFDTVEKAAAWLDRQRDS